MTYEVLAVAPDVGVARWIASHTNEREGRRFRYDGVFVITLTDEGLCRLVPGVVGLARRNALATQPGA